MGSSVFPIAGGTSCPPAEKDRPAEGGPPLDQGGSVPRLDQYRQLFGFIWLARLSMAALE